MRRSSWLIATAGVVCLLTSACGDEPATEAETTAQPAAQVTATPTPQANALEPFLLRDGEEPGFKRILEPRTDTGVDAYVQAGDVPDEAAERLRRAGFESFTYQPVVVEGGNAGVSNVHLFETEQGARAWLKWETSTAGIRQQLPDTKIRRFTVDGVPGARGWTGTDLHDNRIGTLYWVQGRCMLGLANEGRGDFVEPLSAGARAIHERTQGTCP